MNRQGHFVWYDLSTSDQKAAEAFYTEVVGFRTQPGERNGEPYTRLLAGGVTVAGMRTLAADAQARGIPPQWMPHVDVENMDTSAQRVVELGGRMLEEPQHLENVGTIATVADPTGAPLSLFHAEGTHMPEHESEQPSVGDITWHELVTTDWDRARTFYNALFGWRETDTMELPDGMGTYWMFQAPGSDHMLGGMFNGAKATGVPPHWLTYFYVGDLDAALQRLQTKGGKVENGPVIIPGGDRVAQCTDPQGAAFALHGK